MPLRLRHRHRQSRSSGVTLVELLVVLAIGGVLLSGAITMVVSHIRTSSQMAALLRLQDQCGRVEFLINHEIQQAERATGTLNTLTLDVPGVTSTGAPTAWQITYSLSNQELRRTGPNIDALGRLEDTQVSNALVARRVTAFNVNTTNPRHPTYTISVQDSNGVTYTSNDNDGAQCRVRQITG